ncbi:RrF2 family transcriptional regulator [Desertivirga brevis]|uniref:RrF2 family transcriptional regulator n=1 Tax=Desertivirga brevis TaxID=2810310 RepID=UPI001A973B78|nr:Rrf2 family transcriptional regulator [Pedobacter sp. SYSU D00873]
MNNTRFATSMHIMVLLALQKGELVSSEYISGSININPAIIRKELSNLKAMGLVASKEGKNGGCTLAKSEKEILLSDIYNAVRQPSLLGKFNDTNQKCPVGNQINKHLDTIYNEAEEGLIQKLKGISLASFCKQFD